MCLLRDGDASCPPIDWIGREWRTCTVVTLMVARPEVMPTGVDVYTSRCFAAEGVAEHGRVSVPAVLGIDIASARGHEQRTT
jgi:hypothetical protein